MGRKRGVSRWRSDMIWMAMGRASGCCCRRSVCCEVDMSMVFCSGTLATQMANDGCKQGLGYVVGIGSVTQRLAGTSILSRRVVVCHGSAA